VILDSNLIFLVRVTRPETTLYVASNIAQERQ